MLMLQVPSTKTLLVTLHQITTYARECTEIVHPSDGIDTVDLRGNIKLAQKREDRDAQYILGDIAIVVACI
jgi:hypothetical protein